MTRHFLALAGHFREWYPDVQNQAAWTPAARESVNVEAVAMVPRSHENRQEENLQVGPGTPGTPVEDRAQLR